MTEDSAAVIAAGRADYDSAVRRGRAIDELSELFRFRHLVVQLVKRNVTSRYKRSFLGLAWTLLDPLLTMGVMAAVYSAIIRDRVEAFPVYILSGLVIWNFFSQSSTQAITYFLHGRALLGRVYMPKATMGVAAVGTGFVNLVASIIPLMVFMVIFRCQFTPALLFVPVAILLASAFTLGVGLLVSAWSVFFGDMENIFRFLLRLAMYLSGIFYSLDILPEQLRRVVWCMPTYHLIELFRSPVHTGTLPDGQSILIGVAWSLGFLLAGFGYFARKSNAYAYRL
ncbi:MAG: ABC transporter permease [Gemmatimonadota bacterium]|jgi:ABC-type polysaccharide/polyol phosphate export permease|nr:ABC transporter permease [Gemmatimonadota bacterium]MDP6802715.1 ABC transporter permease [Gemmatimonadota bacterium]MDP7031764.1 ABC transporter permease [Gemmatimonadota bacterium]